MNKPINLHEPQFDEHDEALVLNAIRSTWVSTGGPYVDQFEKDFAQYVGSRYAISVCNGTVALSLCLEVLKRSLKIDKPFEVIVPSLTFVATVNAVFHSGGFPVLVDCAPGSLNLNPGDVATLVKKFYQFNSHEKTWLNIETRRPLISIMPAHIMGFTCNMGELTSICNELSLPIIEDAAESLGSFDLEGNHVGNSGIAAGFSFNGNKILTTGGGGMIVTNDEAFAKRAKHLSTTAKTDNLRFCHDEVGYNFRLVNPLAALGCSQLPKLNQRLKRKCEIFNLYKNELNSNSIKIVEENFNKPNYWIINCRFRTKIQRENCLLGLNTAGIMCRPLWTPAHHLPFVKDFILPDQLFPNAEDMWDRTLSLPSSPQLLNDDIKMICEKIRTLAN